MSKKNKKTKNKKTSKSLKSSFCDLNRQAPRGGIKSYTAYAGSEGVFSIIT